MDPEISSDRARVFSGVGRYSWSFISNIIEAIDTLRYDYTALEIYNLALQNYKKRLEQLKPYIKNSSLSANDMNILVFACTAWDSKNEAPGALLLAGGEKLKRKILVNHNAELGDFSLSLYDRVAAASSFLKSDPVLSTLTLDQLMFSLSFVIPSPEVQILKTHLDKAAQELQEILNGLLAR